MVGENFKLPTMFSKVQIYNKTSVLIYYLYFFHFFMDFMFLGTAIIFRIYGLVCAVVLVLFTLVNFYNMKEGGFKTELGEDVDPRNVG